MLKTTNASLILAFLCPAACVDSDAESPAIAARPESERLSRPVVDARLQAALDEGRDGAVIELDLRVDVPRFAPPELPPMTATIDVADGLPRYTLDGQPVDEERLRARTDADRRAIDAGLTRQFEARRRLVAAAIADGGVEDAVVERGDTWFRVRLPRERAQALLRALDGRLEWARLADDGQQHTGLRNNTHDGNLNGNALDEGEDGALERMGIIDFAHAYDMRGQGIGIWHNEGFAPWPYRPELMDADIEYLSTGHWQPVLNGGSCRYDEECCSGQCTGTLLFKTCSGNACSCGVDPQGNCMGAPRGLEHATLVAMCAHAAAPDATIYHTTTTLEDCMLHSAVTAQTSPPVYVGAQAWSFVNNDDTNGSYNGLGHCMAEWDDYIRTSRIAHFSYAGNDEAVRVFMPARAYNVIGVGRYDHYLEDMVEPSTFLNPTTGLEKPEILAPGTNLTLGPDVTTGGTSLSAPLAAGFAADLMSGSAFFRNQPQAVKAYMIAGAHNVKYGPGFSSINAARDGAGRIDYLDTYFYRSGKVWNGGNDDFFDAQEKIVETYTLQAGKRYTVAIAWLADGEWASFQTLDPFGLNLPTLSQRLKLTVSRPGYGSWSEYVPENNFQRVDLVVPAGGTGPWTVTIERMYNAGVDGVDLALTVGEHDN
ncbi:Subtilase family protein [Nannocystis exedens]|uniref:Subtilase family protein n=1 Tax=Nannocystis exedens TaxID=54 RepID=A0A1I2GYY8_9BACT|nr:S8 family serine peptidase [Nannocystis exedens]PCC68880.1 hypothetical protein NAEX_01900 [Nannocystis exedens]SFF22360.1 Subtilase family protein [Nannocystis exedens]